MQEPVDKRNCIILRKPFIEHTQYGTARMFADIIEPNRPVFRAFIEVEKEYERYLTPERGDWLLYLAFPVAIRTGYDIVCEVPVTEMLLHNIVEILMPHFLIGDTNSKKFNIYADTSTDIIGGNAVGTGVSCGVDSSYTIMEYTSGKYPSMQLTYLFTASLNAELWDFDEKADTLYTWEEKHAEAFKRFETVSEATGLPLIKMFTNIVWYVCKRDWAIYHHLWVHNQITMASVLSLRKLWKQYYFASAQDFISHFEKIIG